MRAHRPDIIAHGWLLDLARRRGLCVLSEDRVAHTVKAFVGALLALEAGHNSEAATTALRGVAWLREVVGDEAYVGLFEAHTLEALDQGQGQGQGQG